MLSISFETKALLDMFSVSFELINNTLHTSSSGSEEVYATMPLEMFFF